MQGNNDYPLSISDKFCDVTEKKITLAYTKFKLIQLLNRR